MEHILKTWPQYFKEVEEGRKNFEIRRNDRNFKAGDLVVLREFNPTTNEYTDKRLVFRIGYVCDFEQKPGYVVFSLKEYQCDDWKEGRG